MSPNNDTELPQASPPLSTIEDKLRNLPLATEVKDNGSIWLSDKDIAHIQAIITTETTSARIETAQELERIALKAATRTPKDTLDVMVAIERYVKALQKEQK